MMHHGLLICFSSFFFFNKIRDHSKINENAFKDMHLKTCIYDEINKKKPTTSVD